MLRFLLPIPMLAAGVLAAADDPGLQGGILLGPSAMRVSPTFRHSLADADKRFRALTGYAPSGFQPVLIIPAEAGAAPSLSVDSLEGGGLTLRLFLPADGSGADTASFLATALLLREHYGKFPPVPGSKVPGFPSWVTRGVGSLLLAPSDGKAWSEVQQPPSDLPGFLGERVPDVRSVSLLARYDSAAGALIRAGLCDDAGRRAFREYIGSYDPDSNPEDPARWIPGWDMRSVERRWMLGLHASGDGEGGRTGVAVMGPEETLGQYGTIMDSGLGGKDSLAVLRAERGSKFLLDGLTARLTALRLRSNPLIVPLVDGAIALVSRVPRLSPGKIRTEEARLRELAEGLRGRGRAIEDYLDWYEAAKVPTQSGVFEGYLVSPEPAVAKGPIGRHVDAVEERGW
jgi:hypothetical protein